MITRLANWWRARQQNAKRALERVVLRARWRWVERECWKAANTLVCNGTGWLGDPLQGIYAKWGQWEDYDRSEGYRKRPCMVRLRDGRERGPCWPNAGKFCELNGQGEWAERLVVAVCYAESAEDSGNAEVCGDGQKGVR